MYSLYVKILDDLISLRLKDIIGITLPKGREDHFYKDKIEIVIDNDQVYLYVELEESSGTVYYVFYQDNRMSVNVSPNWGEDIWLSVIFSIYDIEDTCAYFRDFVIENKNMLVTMLENDEDFKKEKKEDIKQKALSNLKNFGVSKGVCIPVSI